MGIFDSIRKDGKPLVEDTGTPDAKVYQGKITKVDAKGYGFISSIDIPFERIFFHWTSLKHNTINFKELRRGAKVEFVTTKQEDGSYRAYKVDILENGKAKVEK